MTDLLRVAGVCVLHDGHLLGVRKRGTERFMLPGGKLEPGEPAVLAGARELVEETGLAVDAADLALLGEFEADAANEAGTRIHATVFVAPATLVAAREDVAVRAEIEELRWLAVRPPYATDLAPLLLEHVLPRLRGQPPGRMGGMDRVELYGGQEHVVRRVTGSASTKPYRCPGCHQVIRPATPHTVAWPVLPTSFARDAEGIDERRHWHTACWGARDRRR